MGKLWQSSVLASPSDLTGIPEVTYNYLGEHIAASPDGEFLVASSEGWGQLGRVYVYRKVGGTWAFMTALDPEFFVLWEETFDGAIDKEKLTSETPSGGSIVEGGGRLTITTNAAGVNDWNDCPVAWRYDYVSTVQRLRTTISAVSAVAGAGGGICIYDDGFMSPVTRAEAALLEVRYNGSNYEIQQYKVEASVITAVGSPIAINDPNTTPIELEFLYDVYNGWAFFWYRQGTTEWSMGQETDWADMVYYGARAGLYARRSGMAGATSIVFDSMESLAGQILNVLGDVAVKNDTIAVGRERGQLGIKLLDDFTPAALAAGDEFGFCITGGYGENLLVGYRECIVAVGAPGDSLDAGKVHILQQQLDGSWSVIQTITGSDTVAGDRFGSSASFAREGSSYNVSRLDRLVVGAPHATVGGNASAGAVYVFERNAAGVWVEIRKITAAAPCVNGRYGSALEMTRYYPEIAIGEPGGNGGRGAAYLEVRDAFGVWSTEASISAADGAIGDEFGAEVGIDHINRYVYVGAPQHNGAAGAVYVHTRAGTLIRKLIASDGAGGDEFGAAIDLEIDCVIVGAPGKNADAGCVYWYDQAIELRIIEPGYLVAGDRFGCAVSLNYDRLVVGADGNGVTAGYVVCFHCAYASRAITDLGKQNYGAPSATDRYGKSALFLTKEFYVCSPGKNLSAGASLACQYGIYTYGQGWPGSLIDIYRLVGGNWQLFQTIESPLNREDSPRFGADVALSTDGRVLLGTTRPTIGWGGPFAWVFRDSGAGYIQEAAFLPEIATDLDGSYNLRLGLYATHGALTGDGSRAILYNNANSRSFVEKANNAAFTDLVASLPNADCAVSKSSSRINVLADATNNPADWNGGSIRSCPLLYANPFPLQAGGNREIKITVRLYDLDTADTTNAYAGFALYDDPALDALVVEYNRATQRVVVWKTEAGGAKEILYISDQQGDLGATSNDLEIYALFNPATGLFRIYRLTVASTQYISFEATLGFAPTNLGLFCRIADPATSSATAKFYHLVVETKDVGKLFVYDYSGGIWSLTQATETIEGALANTPDDILVPYCSTTQTYTRVGLSASGNWLALEHRIGDLTAWWKGLARCNVYRLAGSSFILHTALDPGDYHADGYSMQNVDVEDGPNSTAVLAARLYDSADNPSLCVLNFEGAWALDTLITRPAGASYYIEEDVVVADSGRTIFYSDPYVHVNPAWYGLLYVITGVDAFMRLPIAGFYIDEIRGISHT